MKRIVLNCRRVNGQETPRDPSAARAGGRLKQKLRTRRHLVATARGSRMAGAGRRWPMSPTRPTCRGAPPIGTFRRSPSSSSRRRSKACGRRWRRRSRPGRWRLARNRSRGASTPRHGDAAHGREHEPLLRSMIQLTVSSRPPVTRRAAGSAVSTGSSPRFARQPTRCDRVVRAPRLGADRVCRHRGARRAARHPGLSTAQAVEMSRWMARAILRQALADARRSRRRR